MNLFSASIFSDSNQVEDKAIECLMVSENRIAHALTDIKENEALHLWNHGSINLHHILEEICHFLGKGCRVTLCTWSLSVPAMKVISKLITDKYITHLDAVIDFRTRKDHPEAFAMALEMFSSLYILPCHAKCIVIQGSNMSFSIIGSANLTNNPKAERIIVFRSDEIVSFDLASIFHLISQAEKVK